MFPFRLLFFLAPPLPLLLLRAISATDSSVSTPLASSILVPHFASSAYSVKVASCLVAHSPESRPITLASRSAIRPLASAAVGGSPSSWVISSVRACAACCAPSPCCSVVAVPSWHMELGRTSPSWSLLSLAPPVSPLLAPSHSLVGHMGPLPVLPPRPPLLLLLPESSCLSLSSSARVTSRSSPSLLLRLRLPQPPPLLALSSLPLSSPLLPPCLGLVSPPAATPGGVLPLRRYSTMQPLQSPP